MQAWADLDDSSLVFFDFRSIAGLDNLDAQLSNALEDFHADFGDPDHVYLGKVCVLIKDPSAQVVVLNVLQIGRAHV